MLAIILPLLLLTICLSVVLFLLYTDSESIKQALIRVIFPSARKVQIHLAKHEIQSYIKTRVAAENATQADEDLDTEDINSAQASNCSDTRAKTASNLSFRKIPEIDNGSGSVKKSNIAKKFNPEATVAGSVSGEAEDKVPKKKTKRVMRSFIGLVRKHKEILRDGISSFGEDLYNPCQVFYKIRNLEQKIWKDRKRNGYTFLRPILEFNDEDSCCAY